MHRPPTPRVHSTLSTSPVVNPLADNQTRRPTLKRPPPIIRIAFSGKLCSGKTHLATHMQTLSLLRDIDLQKISFGQFVKEVAHDYFQMATTKHKKQRKLLTDIGTAMRNIYPDVWVNCVKQKINDSEHVNWVVDDVRHKNEMKMLKQLGFTIVRLNIDENIRLERIHDLYENAADHVNGAQHSSETELDNCETFDMVVDEKNGIQKITNWFDALFQH